MTRMIRVDLLSRLTSDLADSIKELEDLRVKLSNDIKDSNLTHEVINEEYLTYVSEASKRSGLIVAIANECKLLEDDIKYNINVIPQEAAYASMAQKQSSTETLDASNFASLFAKPPKGSPSGSKN